MVLHKKLEKVDSSLLSASFLWFLILYGRGGGPPPEVSPGPPLLGPAGDRGGPQTEGQPEAARRDVQYQVQIRNLTFWNLDSRNLGKETMRLQKRFWR